MSEDYIAIKTLDLIMSSKMSDEVLQNLVAPWWCHQMETFSALLALCAGNSPVTGEFPAQRPVTRSFDVSFDLRLNKRLSKQSWGWWFETPSCSLWCHRNAQCGHVMSYMAAWILKIFVSVNGMLPTQHQAITWTNADLLLIGSLGTNLSEIWTKIQNSFNKMSSHALRQSDAYMHQ